MDVTAIVALVVAVVALIVAAAQFTQQIMATAYVIRKCDRIVTGGLTKGGTRQWHWRQFRFTVNYQAIVFTLPNSVYTALGVSPTVQVITPSPEIWDRAVKTRPSRKSTQACWISLVQDLVTCTSLRREDICVIEESADRIPDDLTVAPARVDALTAILSCIAMGMQVYKYSPTDGEIIMAGGVGSISSSNHPVLGGLVHYSVFSNEPRIGLDKAQCHGRALVQREGVWANAVFGRFRDRSFRPEPVPLKDLRHRKLDVLRQRGWPENSYTDTIGGAACFLAFAHVDVYQTVPPSVVRPWCAHFAEVIIKIQHGDIIKDGLNSLESFSRFGEYRGLIKARIESQGCSSPYLAWEGDMSEEKYFYPSIDSEIEPCVQCKCNNILTPPSLVDVLASTADLGWRDSKRFVINGLDPSSYTPVFVAWEVILRADQCMHFIARKFDVDGFVESLAEHMIARSIRFLAEVGAPSFGTAAFKSLTEDWQTKFSQACDEVLNDHSVKDDNDTAKWARLYAHFSILRASYYTIMMRAADDIGPGLNEDVKIDTALLYMV